MRKMFLILFLGLVLAGCLSGPLPEDTPKVSLTTPPVTTPPPSIDTVNFISIEEVTPFLAPPVGDVPLLEMGDLVRLPFNSPTDVLSNDLGVLEHPDRLQILASIVARQSFVYVKPDPITDTVLYYTVYSFNDSDSAHLVLDAYRNAWNKRELNTSSGTIYIWDGYLEEMGGMGPALRNNSILYWNPETNNTFMTDRVFPGAPALTRTTSPLYSIHGESVVDNYFLMMDSKSDLDNIKENTDKLFLEALQSISKDNASLNETLPLPDKDTNKTTGEIKEELRLLLESYLEGNISKEEYETQFTELNKELGA